MLHGKLLVALEGTMPVAFQLQNVLPDIDFMGGDLIIKSGAAAGKVLQITKIAGDKVVLGPADASSACSGKARRHSAGGQFQFFGCTNVSPSPGTRKRILCMGPVS